MNNATNHHPVPTGGYVNRREDRRRGSTLRDLLPSPVAAGAPRGSPTPRAALPPGREPAATAKFDQGGQT